MSYARFATSSLYLYYHPSGYIECHECTLTRPEVKSLRLYTSREAISHIYLHLTNRDTVPSNAKARIISDYPNLDALIPPDAAGDSEETDVSQLKELYADWYDKYAQEFIEYSEENYELVSAMDEKLVWTDHSTCDEGMLSPGAWIFDGGGCCYEVNGWYIGKTPWGK
jgi:hypothetical protein